jgi:putative spermidine/putrescine transport system permease protein
MRSVNTTNISTPIKVKEKHKLPKRNVWNLVLGLFSMGVILFLSIPLIIVVLMSFSSASSLEFPPPGFSFRWYSSFFTDPLWMEAVRTSVLVSAAASTIALIFGVLASYGLSVSDFRGKNLIIGNFIAPMIIPTIITGVALYLFFAQIGLLGTMPGLILAHVLVAFPYIVLITLPAFEAFDRRLELAAKSLGGSWVTVFRKILIPLHLPSILASWLFAFIISFDELIVTVFLAGEYMTLPKKMFNELILQINPTITAISTVLILLTGIFMFIVSILLKISKKKGAEISDFLG